MAEYTMESGDVFAWQRRDGHAVMRQALGLPAAARDTSPAGRREEVGA